MSDNNKCALEVLRKNSLIDIEEKSHSFCRAEIPNIDFIYITFFDKNPKFNERLKEILKKKYINWYNKSVDNARIYYYVKKEDIIEWIMNLPVKEKIVIPFWDYKFANFVRDYIEENVPELEYRMQNQLSYEPTRMEIRNLKVIEERERRENEKDEEALELLDKLF